MTFTIDNQTETTLNELIQANELDQNTINELINLKENETYYIGICEIKKTGQKIKYLGYSAIITKVEYNDFTNKYLYNIKYKNDNGYRKVYNISL